MNAIDKLLVMINVLEDAKNSLAAMAEEGKEEFAGKNVQELLKNVGAELETAVGGLDEAVSLLDVE